MFLKKQKGLAYRKKKIETLNFREYFIRENQKLRDEIKLYRYYWQNSSLFNYNQIKQKKLNLIVGLRKQKKHLFNLMQKYPEGMLALKERIKNNQYYTGLSLLKRKQNKALVFRFKRFIRALRYPTTQVLFWSTAGKMGFAGPKRPTPYATQTLGRFISTKLALNGIKFVNLKLHTKVNKYVRSFLRGMHMTEDNVRPVRIHKMIFPLEFSHGMLRKRKQRRV